MKTLGYNTVGVHKLGINTSRINTGKIIDALNNNALLEKLSPLKKYSNAGVNALKFIIGPDANLIDKIAEQLRTIRINSELRHANINILHYLI